jgi:predicted Zn-dependent protease with MMP-like domain
MSPIFDEIIRRTILDLPTEFRRFLKEVPVIIEDEARPEHLQGLDANEQGELFGLYVGTPITAQSPVGAPSLEPGRIYIFRGPLLRTTAGDAKALAAEIRTTLLHEIGHHLGMNEDDLERLRYD